MVSLFMMKRNMIAMIHDNKIFYSVVKFVSVNVVDAFMFFKGTIQVMAHDKTMLRNIASIFTNKLVSSEKNKILMESTFDWGSKSFVMRVVQITIGFCKMFLAAGLQRTQSVFRTLIFFPVRRTVYSPSFVMFSAQSATTSHFVATDYLASFSSSHSHELYSKFRVLSNLEYVRETMKKLLVIALLLCASIASAATNIYTNAKGVIAIERNGVLVWGSTKVYRATDVTLIAKPTEDWVVINTSGINVSTTIGTPAGFLASQSAIRYESNYQGTAIVYANGSGKTEASVAAAITTYIAANPLPPVYGTVPIMKEYSQTFDPPSLAANASAIYSVTVNGLAVGDIVLISKPTYTAGWIITGGLVTGSNTLQVQVRNLTGSAIDPPSETYSIVGIRP